MLAHGAAFAWEQVRDRYSQLPENCAQIVSG